MSMIANYYRVTPSELAEMEAHPEAAAEKLIESRHSHDPTGRSFCLEKEWHALDYLLSGKAELGSEPEDSPTGRAVRGWRETAIEGSYGPLRVLDAPRVVETAAALEAISVADLQQRFSGDAFDAAEIYPHSSQGGWTADELEPLLELYPNFVRFFVDAAHAGDEILISID